MGAANGNMITAPGADRQARYPVAAAEDVVEQRHLISPVIGTDHSPSRGPTKKERRAVKPDAKETAWLIREEWAKPSSFIGTHRKRHPRRHLNSLQRVPDRLSVVVALSAPALTVRRHAANIRRPGGTAAKRLTGASAQNADRRFHLVGS